MLKVQQGTAAVATIVQENQTNQELTVELGSSICVLLILQAWKMQGWGSRAGLQEGP